MGIIRDARQLERRREEEIYVVDPIRHSPAENKEERNRSIFILQRITVRAKAGFISLRATVALPRSTLVYESGQKMDEKVINLLNPDLGTIQCFWLSHENNYLMPNF